jgi:hypothetical protein
VPRLRDAGTEGGFGWPEGSRFRLVAPVRGSDHVSAGSTPQDWPIAWVLPLLIGVIGVLVAIALPFAPASLRSKKGHDVYPLRS